MRVVQQRLEHLLEVQAEISGERNREFLGRSLDVLVDGVFIRRTSLQIGQISEHFPLAANAHPACRPGGISLKERTNRSIDSETRQSPPAASKP